MADKELTIKLKVDNTEAKQATTETISDFKKVDAEARKTSDAERKRIKEVWSDTETAERAKMAIIDRTNKEKLAALVKLKDAEKETGQAGVQAMSDVGKTGVDSFTGINSAMSMASAGFGKLIEFANTFNQAVTAAAAKSREMAAGFTSERDKLRDLAAMMGVKGDNAFALENARFNTNAMMRTDEGLSFRSAFQGVGAQFAGKSMSEAEFKEYEADAAKLTSAKGLDAKVGGELSGGILGMRNFSKFGNKASEEALGATNKVLAVLARGRGDNSVMSNQMSMFSSAAVSDDAMKGAIENPVEAAAVVSTMAETSPTRAADLSKSAIKGLRSFENPLIKEAKITPQMTPIEAATRLNAVLEAKAKSSGLKPIDILRASKFDDQSSEALAVLTGKGVGQGILKDRMEYSEGFGADAAKATVSDFESSEVGQARKADAQIAEAKAKRGAENSAVEILRRQALAKLIAEKRIDSTNKNMLDLIDSKISFNMIPTGEQERIDAEVHSMLDDRATAAGGQSQTVNGGKQIRSLPLTPEGREAFFNSRINDIKQRGFNPFSGMPEPAPGPAPMMNQPAPGGGGDPQAQRDLLEVNKEQLKAMKEAERNARGGALPAAPAPSMRRS